MDGTYLFSPGYPPLAPTPPRGGVGARALRTHARAGVRLTSEHAPRSAQRTRHAGTLLDSAAQLVQHEGQYTSTRHDRRSARLGVGPVDVQRRGPSLGRTQPGTKRAEVHRVVVVEGHGRMIPGLDRALFPQAMTATAAYAQPAIDASGRRTPPAPRTAHEGSSHVQRQQGRASDG